MDQLLPFAFRSLEVLVEKFAQLAVVGHVLVGELLQNRADLEERRRTVLKQALEGHFFG